MIYTTQLIVAGTLIVSMGTAVCMHEFITIPFSDAAAKPLPKIKRIAKKRALRKINLRRYKDYLPHIKKLLNESSQLCSNLEQLVLQEHEGKGSQLSKFEKLCLEHNVRSCIAEIDAYSYACRSFCKSLPWEKKLFVMNVLRTYGAERTVLHAGLEYMCMLLQIDHQVLDNTQREDTESIARSTSCLVQ